MEELARTQALSRRCQAASAAELRACVDKYCKALWQLPQDMRDKWDTSLTAMRGGSSDEVTFHSDLHELERNSAGHPRKSVSVSVKIVPRPPTASNLRDGTNRLVSFGQSGGFTNKASLLLAIGSGAGRSRKCLSHRRCPGYPPAPASAQYWDISVEILACLKPSIIYSNSHSIYTNFRCIY